METIVFDDKSNSLNSLNRAALLLEEEVNCRNGRQHKLMVELQRIENRLIFEFLKEIKNPIFLFQI